MDRTEAVEILASKAAELRLDMKEAHEGVLPPEILLVLAYEQAILRRFKAAYDAALEDNRKIVDAAKQRCAEQSGWPEGSEERQRYADQIVKGDFLPSQVVEIKCGTCHQGRPVVDILSNLANARPLWTYYLDFDALGRI